MNTTAAATATPRTSNTTEPKDPPMHSTMGEVALTVTEILRHASSICGDRVVTTATEDGFREVTYRQLATRIAQLSGGLKQLGIIGNARVATYMWNNQEHLEAYLAVPCMGAVLHTLNIRLTAEDLAYIGAQAHDEVVMVDASLSDQLAEALPRMPSVHTVVVVGDDGGALRATDKTVITYEELLHGQPTTVEWPDLDEKHAAAICYTSGTTGRPKGIVYSHRSTYLHSMAVCSVNGLTVGAGDRVLPIVPMFHANAWGLPYAALMAGADLLLPDRFVRPDRLIDMIESHKPTIAAAVPTIWSDVLQALRTGPGRDLSSLRVVPCGGSAVPLVLMRELAEKHGVQIRQAWGMTETSPLAAVAWPPHATAEADHWALRATQGRPICGVQVRIVDEDGKTLPHDAKAVGELQVRGPWVTASYYADDDATKFQDGWLRTGDVGRIDSQGFISLTDRAKDVIKSGGEWISSVQLERSIMEHPGVREAAVIAVPDPRWQERPLAVVVCDAELVHPRELRSFLSDKVSRWWLPEWWAFVEALPRTSVGKFDKRLLRAHYAENIFRVTDCRD